MCCDELSLIIAIGPKCNPGENHNKQVKNSKLIKPKRRVDFLLHEGFEALTMLDYTRDDGAFSLCLEEGYRKAEHVVAARTLLDLHEGDEGSEDPVPQFVVKNVSMSKVYYINGGGGKSHIR